MSDSVKRPCGKAYRLRDEYAGKHAKCMCGHVIVMPKPSLSRSLKELLDELTPEDLMCGEPVMESSRRSPSKKRPNEAMIVSGVTLAAVVTTILIAIILRPESIAKSHPNIAEATGG